MVLFKCLVCRWFASLISVLTVRYRSRPNACQSNLTDSALLRRPGAGFDSVRVGCRDNALRGRTSGLVLERFLCVARSVSVRSVAVVRFAAVRFWRIFAVNFRSFLARTRSRSIFVAVRFRSAFPAHVRSVSAVRIRGVSAVRIGNVFALRVRTVSAGRS